MNGSDGIDLRVLEIASEDLGCGELCSLITCLSLSALLIVFDLSEHKSRMGPVESKGRVIVVLAVECSPMVVVDGDGYGESKVKNCIRLFTSSDLG